MKHNIKATRSEWKVESGDYADEGGLLTVSDCRPDGEGVAIEYDPEDSVPALLEIDAPTALSLGLWLVKTFGPEGGT